MESHTNRTLDIPKWSALLVEAVNKPGPIMKAYSAFWPYSLGNQMLAQFQCHLRGLTGPINTFPKWKELGRHVKRGERALILCMPITRKRRDDESNHDEVNGEKTFTAFVHKPNWFALSQTEGQELPPSPIPNWDAERALATLNIERIPFDQPDGNCQGYATKNNQIAINPVAQLPIKTLFHEAAHCLHGHTRLCENSIIRKSEGS